MQKTRPWVPRGAHANVRIPTPPDPIDLGMGIKIACDTWIFWSHKAGDRLVTLYGPLEFDYAMYLEASRDVICWREQPVKFSGIRANGKGYVLDYWKYLTDGEEYIGEVKEHRHLVDNPELGLMPKDWVAASAAIRDWGATPEFQTEKDLEQHQYLIGNWRHAVGHIARAYFHDDRPTRHKILRLVDSRSPITIGEIEGHLSSIDPNDVWAQTIRLLQEDRVSANIESESIDRCLKIRPAVH